LIEWSTFSTWCTIVEIHQTEHSSQRYYKLNREETSWHMLLFSGLFRRQKPETLKKWEKIWKFFRFFPFFLFQVFRGYSKVFSGVCPCFFFSGFSAFFSVFSVFSLTSGDLCFMITIVVHFHTNIINSVDFVTNMTEVNTTSHIF